MYGPTPEREDRVRRELQAHDPRLDITWNPVAVVVRDVNEDVESYYGRYALIYWLSDNDPLVAYARRTGQKGLYQNLGWFCKDVTNAETDPVPPDELLPRVFEWLGAMDNERENWRQRVREVEEANRQLYESQKRDFRDEAVQRALEMRRQVLGIPFISTYVGGR